MTIHLPMVLASAAGRRLYKDGTSAYQPRFFFCCHAFRLESLDICPEQTILATSAMPDSPVMTPKAVTVRYTEVA